MVKSLDQILKVDEGTKLYTLYINNSFNKPKKKKKKGYNYKWCGERRSREDILVTFHLKLILLSTPYPPNIHTNHTKP